MIFWRKDKKEPETTDTTPPQEVIPPQVPPELQSQPEPQPVAETLEAIEAAEDILANSANEDGNWFSRLSRGLSKSSTRLTQNIGDLITKKRLDQDTLDQLEDALIMADLGPRTAARIVDEFSRDRFGKDISEDEIKTALAESIADILAPVAQPFAFGHAGDGPQVILVCGVNGVGKTTTIGKISHELQGQGRSVTLGAGDTFRAAAVEQLAIWAGRTGSHLVKKDVGADAAAVAYESYAKARDAGSDILMIDTAGRLHNKSNLMAELEKIIRVLKKQDESLPHAVWLVLDATTGQNAIEQVRTFKEMVNVTGLIVTKLDGSARGGIVVALADQFGIPIHFVGVGETAKDLRPFDPMDFARSLVGLTA